MPSAFATAIDALVIASRQGKNTAVVFEWKYTEEPETDDMPLDSDAGTIKMRTYKPLIESSEALKSLAGRYQSSVY